MGKTRLLVLRGERWQRWAVLAALGALTVVPRVGALGPSSLWQDDAWPALVARLDSPADISLVGMTSIGWSFLLKGVLAVTGVSSIAAQAPAFVAALLTPPVVVLLARRVGLGRVAAVLAGVFVAVAPAHIAASVRVKANTTGGLLAALVLLVTLWALEGRTGRRWAAVAASAAGAVLVTAEVLPVLGGVVVACAVAGMRWRDRPALVAGGAVAMSALLGYLAVRGRVTDRLRQDWDEGYVTLDDGVTGVVRSVAGRVVDLGQAVSGLWPLVLVLLVAGAAVVLGRRRPEVAVLLLVPVALAGLAALLQQAPIGVGANRGRVNLVLHPALAVVAASALDELVRRQRTAGHAVVAAVATLGAVTMPFASYRQEDLRPVVDVLDDRVRADELVLVDPVAEWATTLYTRFPAAIYADDETATAFRPRIVRPHTVIAESGDDHDELVADALAAADDPPVVWLVRLEHGGADGLADALDERGYRSETVARAPGARLERWARGVGFTRP